MRPSAELQSHKGLSLPTPVTQQSSPSLLPPELTPSAAPFRPSQSPQPTPLPPPPPPPLVREGSWLTGVPSVSDLPTVATLNSTDGGWEQAREAFHAAGGARGPDGRPDVGEGATRIAGEPQPSPAADALIMHGFSRGLPAYAQSLPPRAPPPLPFFSFDPWAATPEETPPSSTSTSPFPTSLSPLPPTRPQTYPPVQRAVHSPFPQDQRKTAPVPLHPTPNFHRDRRYDFPSAPSPPLYPHFSQPPSHAPLHSWAANSPAGPSQEGYHLFSDPGRHSSSPPGYGVPVPRVDVAVYRRSSNHGEGRRPPPSHAAQPRRRQQSFETGDAASGNHPTFARTSRSYGPPGAVPPPLADRQPFLSSRAQSAPTVQSSSSLPPPSSGAVKLRSGLPERSTWAMWVGNVPADATEGELWVFFSHRPPLLNPEAPSESITGVESIHLIARSNCAFVNFISNDHLQHAITHSSGIPLRLADRKCKPLVCRVRMREDDAKSGVGAQRGGGLHKAYVKALQDKVKEEVVGSEGVSRARSPSPSAESNSSSSSSLFTEHFPKRYFILKAHSGFDLEESIRTGTWSTQGHNEAVLDQAFRTSKEGVYIFFSANKSGNWAGYARMAGPIFGPEGQEAPPPPAPLQLPDSSLVKLRPTGLPTPPDSLSPVSPPPMPNLSLVESNATGSSADSAIQRPSPARTESGGTPFAVDWLRTDPLPFGRTRHILNSFNSGREVKISRDGTEVEPIAGEQLIQEFWRDLHDPSPTSSSSSPSPFDPSRTSSFSSAHPAPGVHPPPASNRGRRPSRTPPNLMHGRYGE